MNIIGKIFVFAVFIMSLVFMTFAIALFATNTNWREEIVRDRNSVKPGESVGYKFQLEDAKKEREKLTTDITKLTNEVAASEAARDQVIAQMQTAIEEKNKDLEVLRKTKETREKEREEAQQELAATHVELKIITDEIKGLRVEVREQQSIVDGQLKMAAELAEKLHTSESSLQIVSERKTQLEKQVANARLLLKQSGLSIDSPQKDLVPTVEGQVTAVNKDTIEFNLGSDDGIQAGIDMVVYRHGKYLGKVKVRSVKTDRANADVIGKNGVILQGDRVATRLK